MHSARIKKLIGIDIQMVTYQKYLESGKHLQAFIKHKYKVKDIKLKTLRNSFIDDYVYFLKEEKVNRTLNAHYMLNESLSY